MFIINQSINDRKSLMINLKRLEDIYISWYDDINFVDKKMLIYIIPFNEKKPLAITNDFAIPLYLNYPDERLIWYITHEITEFFLLRKYGYISRWFYEGFAQINGFEMTKEIYGMVRKMN